MKRLLKVIGLVILIFIGGCLALGIYGSEINPNENDWLPFFGLAFPVFFWSNLVALVLLFFRKSVVLIIPLVALVYAWPSTQNYYKIFSKSDFSKAEIEELSLLSYNVRIFDVHDHIKGNAADSIFDFLHSIESNVMCFQEFYYEETPGNFNTKSQLLNDLNLPNSHEHYTHHMRGGKHAGVATFTSLPIINRGVITFESDANNVCIFSDLVIGPDTVRVYNTHLSSIRFQNEDYELLQEANANLNLSSKELKGYGRIYTLLKKAYEKRVLQLQKVLDNIYECPYPVVLAGDFNDTPVSYCYAQTRKYLTDSFVESGSGVGSTYIGDFPSFRIDYIFHSEEIESADYTTFQKEFSDHKPIFTKLRVKPL